MPCEKASAMSGQFQFAAAVGAYLRINVDIPGERSFGLGTIDGELAALEPFAAELAEDRGIDVHVLARTGDAAQRRAPEAVVRSVQRGGVGDERLRSSAGFSPFAS